MGILKLKPSCKDYLWGGRRLAEEYGKVSDRDVIAETWELSCHPDGPSSIVNGPFAGMTLPEYIEHEGRSVLGTHCRRFRDFPILIKFIDAKDNLSVQVHPNNRYALKNEGQYGKTEMWYVMDAGRDACLYYGFKRAISKEEFEERIRKDTLLEVLNAVPVHKGDVLFIESGTIHAIGKDILIAEIQQNSNVTYRVYDYGRVGTDGKKRDLHIEKALAVTNCVPVVRDGSSYPHIADCDYFTVDRLNLDGRIMSRVAGKVSEESFVSILILDGQGEISDADSRLEFKKGDSLFIPAGNGDYTVKGICDALVTTIREKSGPIRIGIDISSTGASIGLVDVHQHVIASDSLQFVQADGRTEPENTLGKICRQALNLMEREGIDMDQCIGVGVGAPGTIDRKAGIVRYSNHLEWENVAVQKIIAGYFPVPVYIANDADCAALGEICGGAGRDYQDAVMITLGNGVGGGLVLNGRVHESRGIGGSELGHMVIVAHGEACTCGRHGCLEAYVSVPALVREAARACGQEMTPSEIFAQAAAGDSRLQKVVDQFIDHLGTGIVNIVNLFRPQVVLIGGVLAGEIGPFMTVISEIVQKNCFGGNKGDVPEIAIAALGGQSGIIGAANLVEN